VIALAYFSIPISILWFVRRREDLAFSWVFVMFGAFILLCGTTHVFQIWTLWHAQYYAEGAVKAATAIASLATAAALVPILPRALALRSPAQLEAEVASRTAELARAHRDLETIFFVASLEFLRTRGTSGGEEKPLVVLLDVNMPRMNGFEVLGEIKASPLLKHIPVVMLTTSGREEDMVKSYRSGAASYIIKPATFDGFRELLACFARYWTTVARVPPLRPAS
jgi:CheY-like chemotaxis protein